ncbi:heme-binding protein, partial [Mesorhizobium loti]
MPELTLDHAQRLVAQGEAAAREAGLKAVFAVLDKGANLVTFSRMDGAWLASNELAIAKARTSVMFQAPTEALNAPLQIGEPVLHFDHI